MNIGNRIKKLRESKGLTQKELGKKVGVTAVTITRYERGDRNPSIEMLSKIADVLDVTVNDLVGVLTFKGDEQEILKQIEENPFITLSEKNRSCKIISDKTDNLIIKEISFGTQNDKKIANLIEIINSGKELSNEDIKIINSYKSNNINKLYETLANSTNFNHQLFRERIGISLEKMASILDVNKYELEKIEKKESNDKKLIVDYKIYLSELYDLKEFIQREVSQAIFSDTSNVDILKLTHLTTYQRLELLNGVICYLNKILSNLKDNSDNNK